MIIKFNPFHLVTRRPWPLMSSIQIYRLIIITIFNNYIKTTKNINFISTIFLIAISFKWWKNINREANKEGLHIKKTIKGIKIGILLFILSEIIFFARFFWSYFHSRIRPNVEIGQIWPPIEVKTFNPINVPLLNTIILVRSGFSITISHHLLIENKYKNRKNILILTFLLGFYFSLLQIIEYKQAEFCINDSAYGTIFFIATGFHGVHVLIGSSFIFIITISIKKILITKKHHIGFEIAAWYWHFVDIVWLFLYLSIYWWGK